MSFKEHQIEPISLLQFLSSLLEEDLGKYQIANYQGEVLTSVPSIWISPPQLPSNRDIVKDSGIECLISRMSEQSPIDCANQQNVILKSWKILLIQHNKTLTTEKAIEKIIHSFSVSSVNLREQQERKEGLFLEQAKLILTDWKLLK